MKIHWKSWSSAMALSGFFFVCPATVNGNDDLGVASVDGIELLSARGFREERAYEEPAYEVPSIAEPDYHPEEKSYQPCPSQLPGKRFCGGFIPVDPIEHYPRISALDWSGGMMDTWRPNLMGRDVPVGWDYMNIINTDRPDFTDATFTVGKKCDLCGIGVHVSPNGYGRSAFKPPTIAGNLTAGRGQR